MAMRYVWKCECCHRHCMVVELSLDYHSSLGYLSKLWD